MDGQLMTKADQYDSEVMDYAVAIAGMMYHTYGQRECSWMAEEAVRKFARKSDRNGVGSILGEGLSQIAGAAPANSFAEILAGNHKIARKAIAMGFSMPPDDVVYDAAIERGVVPESWRGKAFR